MNIKEENDAKVYVACDHKLKLQLSSWMSLKLNSQEF